MQRKRYSNKKRNSRNFLLFSDLYNIIKSRTTVMIILIIMSNEFSAPDKPTSSCSSYVKPGSAEQMGLNAPLRQITALPVSNMLTAITPIAMKFRLIIAGSIDFLAKLVMIAQNNVIRMVIFERIEKSSCLKKPILFRKNPN